MGLPLARAAERYNYFYTVSYHLLTRTIVAGPHATGRLVWCSGGVCLLSNALQMGSPRRLRLHPPTRVQVPPPHPLKGASWTVINPSSQGTGLLLTSVSQECGKLQLAAAGAGASGSGAGEGAGAESPAKRRKLDASAYPRG
jgi:hypothetical protein